MFDYFVLFLLCRPFLADSNNRIPTLFENITNYLRYDGNFKTQETHRKVYFPFKAEQHAQTHTNKWKSTDNCTPTFFKNMSTS